jgi:hypothetical protein
MCTMASKGQLMILKPIAYTFASAWLCRYA